MLKVKHEQLCKLLFNKIRNMSTVYNKQKGEIGKELKEKYNIPFELSSPLLNGVRSVYDESPQILYWLASVIIPDEFTSYFSEKENKEYSKSKFIRKHSDVLEFKMIQIDEDQWIGKISASELISLASKELIHYDDKTQRPLVRKVTKDGEEHYRIFINQKAVKEIKEYTLNKTYIPNTITLNIPQNQTFPEYDIDNCLLIIKDLQWFDIIDGYHRYLALLQNSYQPNFDYPMELRIVSFSEEKAKRFIWQEDQKTKMKKVDLEAYNTKTPQYKTVELLKKKGGMPSDLIDKQSVIDPAILMENLKLFFYDSKKSEEVKNIINAVNEVYAALEKEILNDPEIFSKKWNNYDVCSFIYKVKTGKDIWFGRKEKITINKIINILKKGEK